MYSAKAHEVKKVCLGVKHILTKGEKREKWNSMVPKCTPTLGVTLVQVSQMFRVLIEKTNKHQIELLRYNWKGFEI
jgi:hypothetical protein